MPQRSKVEGREEEGVHVWGYGPPWKKLSVCTVGELGVKPRMVSVIHRCQGEDLGSHQGTKSVLLVSPAGGGKQLSFRPLGWCRFVQKPQKN